MTSKKILAVLAHPDDETLGFGGTLARYADLGVETYLVCATRGQRGTLRFYRQVNLALLEALRACDFAGRVAVRAHDTRDADALANAGADLLLMPFRDGAKEAVALS